MLGNNRPPAPGAAASALNAAGAGEGPPAAAEVAAEEEKRVWKKEPLFRIPSELGLALQSFTEHNTRSKYNKHDVPFQCEVVLGPIKETVRTCWLCGFPIQHLTLLRDETRKLIFSVATPMLDRATCDHVLPVKLAHAILELLYITEDPAHSELLHTEYEYAHNFCNIYKSDEYFVTLPKGSRNLCNLRVKYDILNQVLRRIFYTQRGDPNSAQYSGVKTIYKGEERTFPNIVQAYCFTSDPEAFLADKDKFYRQRWFPSVKRMIIQKILRLIDYVKAADGCSTPSEGTFYKNVPTRLLEGRPNVPKGFKGPSVGRLKGEVAARAESLRRHPSFENILELIPEERRIIPFSAPPYNRYFVDKKQLGPLNAPNVPPGKKPTRKKKTNKSPLESVEAARAENALAAAGAGPAAAEARANFIEAVADEVAADEVAAAPGEPVLVVERALPRLRLPRLERVNDFPPNNNVGLELVGGRRKLRKTRRRKKRM